MLDDLSDYHWVDEGTMDEWRERHTAIAGVGERYTMDEQNKQQLAAVQRLQNAVALAVEAGVSDSDIREWVELAIENNRHLTLNELFPYGSASQHRRFQRSEDMGKLATEIRHELRYNPFKGSK